MIETVRLLNATTWSPDGRTVFTFGAGEIISAADARAAGGFLQVALASGWAEPVARTPRPDRVEAMTSPAPDPDPPRRTAARAAAPRTAATKPKRKRTKQPPPATE